MKGLLIKDMSLMLGQKRFFLIVLGMGIMLMFSGNNPSASIGYITMLITIFSLNTLSYDEHENGMSFLMTLPINRKTYVLEKYVFTGILACVGGTFSMVAAYAVSVIKKIEFYPEEIYVTGGILMAMSILIFAVTFPLIIKFGAEKGRIAMFVVFAMIGVVVAVLAKGVENPDSRMWKVLMTISEMPSTTLVIIGVAVFILMVLLSFFISTNVIMKKEY